jgi:hypothetical protein
VFAILKDAKTLFPDGSVDSLRFGITERIVERVRSGTVGFVHRDWPDDFSDITDEEGIERLGWPETWDETCDDHLVAYEKASLGEIGFAFMPSRKMASSTLPPYKWTPAESLHEDQGDGISYRTTAAWFLVDSLLTRWPRICCPHCHWEGDWDQGETRPPEKCPECGFAERPMSRPMMCRNCELKFDPLKPDGCSYHPRKPELVDKTPDDTDVYRFPCCNQAVVADFPKPTPGCVQGIHMARARKQLLACKNCGQKFDPEKPGGCSYHPKKAEWISFTGMRDECDKYRFPCCGLEYDGWDEKLPPSALPPQSPGCAKGNHEA